MLKKIIFFLFLSFYLFILRGYAQTDPIDSLLNEVLFEDDGYMEIFSPSKNYQFLYSKLNYDTKTFFAGRDIGIDQYNMTGQISYFHSIGISLGAAAAYYSEINPRISTVLLMAGYSGRFTKSMDYRYRISYDRYFFPQSNLLAESSFNSSINGGITINKKLAGMRVDYSLLVGKDYGSQVSGDLYSNINILKFGKFNRIKFEPELSFYFGSDKTIISQVGIVPGRFPKQYYTTQVAKEKFGWMNTELKLPVSISYRNFDFEMGYNLNFPISIVSTEQLKSTSYFNFSIGYLISLSKR